VQAEIFELQFVQSLPQIQLFPERVKPVGQLVQVVWPEQVRQDEEQ